MKKVLSLCLVLILSVLFSLIGPFSVYATGTPITGFDYTNYYELSYLQNNNNAYIDTGIAAKNIYGAEVKFNLTNDTGNIFGQGNLAGSRFYLSSAGAFYSISNGATLTFNTGTDYIFAWQSPSITLNGSSAGSVTYSHSNLTASIFLFAKRFSNSPGPMAGKIYYAKFFDSNADLIGYFVPAERKSDGVYGMFNTVNSTFYTNSGSGSFTAGSRVSYVTQYTITTFVSPSGSGTVNGGGIYDENTSISLSATASSGYVFVKWSDDVTSNPRSITVTQNATYTAIFEQSSTPVTSYTITTSVSPTGGGNVSGGGTYDENTVVVLTATANSGYTFSKWSDDVTTNPRSITVNQNANYTAIFVQNSTPDPDPSPSGWTDWDDSDDSEYLDEITSSIDLNKIYWSTTRERHIDSINIYGTQLSAFETYNGTSYVNFTGTYFDNTITGVNSCSESTYYSSSTQNAPTEQITVHPFIYGQIWAGDSSLNFGVDVTDVTNSSSSVTYSSSSDTTSACRLLGYEAGDGAVDGTTLLALGYEKKTITYNDGTLNGHTATVYVPGDEEYEGSLDMSFLEDLINNLYLNINNNGFAYYHDTITLSLHADDGYLLPEYGSAYSYTFINIFLNGGIYQNSSPNILSDVYHFSNKYDDTYVKYNSSFSRQLLSNSYLGNYTNFYWMGTRNPKWEFTTDLKVDAIDVGNSLDPGFYDLSSSGSGNYGYKLGIGSTVTVGSSMASNLNLTENALIYTDISSMKFYKYKNTSLLNRFNQLGSMVYTWFNRIYQAIGNITGGNESNDIINNVVNDYDIDVDVNLNGLLQNVETYKQNIDLTLPEFNVPSGESSGIGLLAETFKDSFDDIYFDNGLGILVTIPILLIILRLIL